MQATKGDEPLNPDTPFIRWVKGVIIVGIPACLFILGFLIVRLPT